MNHQRRADVMLLLVTICWGVSFPAIKSATAFVSPILFVAIRFVAVTVLMTMAWPGLLRLLPKAEAARGWSLLHDPLGWRWGAELGVLIALGYVTQTIGMHSTSANNSAFITALSVILVPVLLFVLRGVKPGLVVGGAIITAMLGLTLLTRPDVGGLVAGDLWTVGTALAYAFYLIRLSDGLQKISFLPLLYWTVVTCALVTSLAAWLVETPHVVWNTETIVALVVTTLLSTMVALVLQNRWQGETTATRAALIFSAEPVFAALFSYVWLSEMLDGLGWVGGGLILAAVVAIESLGESSGHTGEESLS